MIAFDTNHLLRHVLDDDTKQSAHVHSLIKSAESTDEQIHLLDLVLMEACWVLQSGMGFDRDAWCHVLDSLLQDPVFSFDNSRRLWKALERYRDGRADFDDYLILGHSESIGAKLETFDKKLRNEL
ncbi:MAG: PIN domain-containing protein [Puniceicoccaceae bacterium]